MILPADGTYFPFFGGEPGCSHCFDWSFVSGVKWWTHVSSTVTIRLRNASGSPWYSRRFLRDTYALLAFWESFKSFGTHLAETFVISKWEWIMALNPLLRYAHLIGYVSNSRSLVFKNDQFHPLYSFRRNIPNWCSRGVRSFDALATTFEFSSPIFNGSNWNSIISLCSHHVFMDLCVR